MEELTTGVYFPQSISHGKGELYLYLIGGLRSVRVVTLLQYIGLYPVTVHLDPADRDVVREGVYYIFFKRYTDKHSALDLNTRVPPSVAAGLPAAGSRKGGLCHSRQQYVQIYQEFFPYFKELSYFFVKGKSHAYRSGLKYSFGKLIDRRGRV